MRTRFYGLAIVSFVVGISSTVWAEGESTGKSHMEWEAEQWARISRIQEMFHIHGQKKERPFASIGINAAESSRATVVHKNETGDSFRLVKAIYAIDCAEIYSMIDEEGLLHKNRDFQVFDGRVSPGEHTLTALFVFQGHGFGMFPYLKGYKVVVRSGKQFTVTEGNAQSLVVRITETYMTNDLSKRFQVTVE